MDNMDDARYKTNSLQKRLLGFPQIEATIISAHNVKSKEGTCPLVIAQPLFSQLQTT